MKKLNFLKSFRRILILILLFTLSKGIAFSQPSTVTTTNTFLNNNGTGTVTFNFQNTNAYDVIITTIDGVTGTSGAVPVEFWYKNTPMAGSPGAISAANGWTQVASSTITGIANAVNTNTQNFFSGLSFVVPAGQTYAFAVYALGQRYYTIVAPYLPTVTLTAGGCNIITGTNIGYGGGTPPAIPGNTPRGWIGSITFAPNGPCVNPPTPGTVTSTANPTCPNVNFTLSLTGGTGGMGQLHQWEISPDNISWNTIAGATSATLTTSQLSSNYYRCAVTCGTTVTSSPLQVITNGTALSGAYTINSALPTGGTNFQTFNALVTALSCGGLAGPTVVNVVSGSGPYTEQVEIPPIGGASAVNTLTINGNNETLTFSATVAASPHTLSLNGADHITINALNITGTGATYALACHLWNDADSNAFNNCIFSCPANGTSTAQVPFSISGSATSATATGVATGSYNIIDSCNTVSGYYNLTVVGSSASPNFGNQVTNCQAQDFYLYGIYCYYQNGVIIRNNVVDRPTRTTLSTFYGIYVVTGNTNALVEKNRIRNPFAQLPTSTSTAYGIYSSIDATAGNENRYINNVISSMESNGTVAGLYLTGADYVKVYHNTISLDFAASTAGTTYGIYSTGTVLGSIDMRNNIVSITRGGTGTKYCLYYSTGAPTSNKNVLYINSPAGINNTGYFSGAYPTLANWQTANGGAFDQQSSAVNPLFNAPALNDYAPTELSFNNIGDPVGVTDDITGFTRSLVTPDPGAYEYANAAIDLSLTALITPDSSGCYGAAQNVTVEILNSGLTTIDFSATPVTITCNITGALNTSLNTVINSGTLANNTTLNVTFPTPANMLANGAYTFNANLVLAGDGNPANNILSPSVTRNVGVLAGTISSSLTDICVSGTPTLTAVGAYGGALQWKESIISPAGPWTNVGIGLDTYTPASPVTQTTYYQLDVTCGANNVSSNVDSVIVNNPMVTSTTPDTVCGGNAATLSATAPVGNTINWFTAPAGGATLFTGPTFITPVLNNTTTYYAEASAGGGGAPVAVPMPAQGSNYTGNVRGYWFTSPVNFTLTGVEVLGTTIGSQSIAIVKFNPAVPPPTYAAVTNSFTTLYLTQNNPAVGMIPVNIQINAGDVIGVLGQISNVTSYATPTGPYVTTIDGQSVTLTRMGMQYPLNANAPIDLWQEPGGAIGRVQMYYSTGCAGVRVPVTALVDPVPAITATPAAAQLCEGTSLTLTGGGAGAGGTYTWTGGVTDGMPFNVAVTTIYTVTGTTANGCSNTATSNILVNPILSGTAGVSPNPICLGGSATYTGNIPTICAGNVSGFAGIYLPAFWTNINNNSNGTVNTAGAPANIIMTTGTNNSGIPGSTNFAKTIGCSGNVSFDWVYNNADAFGSIFDYPRYTINFGAPIVFSSFIIGGSNSQNGTETIAVNAGDVVELQAYTIDNDPTPGIITISNFSAPAAPVGGSVSFWDSPIGGVNIGAPPVTVTPAIPGTLTYYAEYTALGTGCVNPVRDPVVLTINGLPTIIATPTTQTICENATAIISGGGAATYAWTGGITDNTPFIVIAPNTYTVTGTDANGCTNTATAEVLMNAAPVVSASATPNTTCDNTTVTPIGSGALSYVWTPPLIDNTPFVANATATYTVTGTDGNGCTATSSITVTVNPPSGSLVPTTSNQTQIHNDDFNINYYGANCDLIATVDDGAGGNVLGLTTSTVNVDATAGFHNGQPFVRRWYQITPTNNGSADVILYINQSDFDDYNAAVVAPYTMLPTTGNNADPNIPNIRITKNSDAGLGNSPIVITPTVNWNGTYWELSFNTPSFSQFRVHGVNPGNVPLPATVTNFSGTKLESSDKLSWTTSSEQNNAYFNLQHSTDGTNFSTIAKVDSKAPNGNSATILNYSSENNKPALGHNYYRLQQVDIDNKVSVHAQIVDLIWGANGSTVSIYPNPATDVLNIDLYATKAQNTSVKLLDMSGRVIKQIQAKSVIGLNNIKLSMGDITSGVYTIQVYENSTLTHTSKVKKNE